MSVELDVYYNRSHITHSTGSAIKVEETKQLFQIENMDIFLIKWYFDYCKGGEFYMVPQKFRKRNLARHSKFL